MKDVFPGQSNKQKTGMLGKSHFTEASNVSVPASPSVFTEQFEAECLKSKKTQQKILMLQKAMANGLWVLYVL